MCVSASVILFSVSGILYMTDRMKSEKQMALCLGESMWEFPLVEDSDTKNKYRSELELGG